MKKNVKETPLAFLYVNGLGTGRSWQEKAIQARWGRSGIRIYFARINWYNKGSFESKKGKVVRLAKRIIKKYGQVVLIGASAGGSLALNSFFELRDKKIGVVSAHGRLKIGDYRKNEVDSLFYKARLNTDKPIQSYYDSVCHFETEVAPRLTAEDKKRILVLRQKIDLVVPVDSMSIEGVKEYVSSAVGHRGGFWVHLIGERDRIVEFARGLKGGMRLP